MKKLMLALSLALGAACSTPTDVPPPSDPVLDSEPTCRSGYAIANRDGEWVCVAEDGTSYTP